MDISLIESLARFWLVNCSRGHAYAVMDIGVSYREDVNVVMAVMRETGSRMRTDPVFEPLMLEPLEIARA